MVISIIPLVARADLLIGVSLPLSGDPAILGKQFLEGARLALKDHNESGGETAALAIADDNCDERIAELAARELIDARPDIVTGILCNSVAYELAGRFRDNGIPVLVAGARSARLIKDRWREQWNLWRLSPGDGDAAKAAVELLSGHWQGKAYAIVDDGTVYGRMLADEFRTGMEELGLPPQFQENFRPTQSTQARLVRRLARAGVTHAFIGTSGEDMAMIARNAAEIGVTLELAGGGELDIIPFLREEDRPPAGLLAVLETRGRDREDTLRLVERIEAAGIPADDHVLLGFQAIQVALQAAVSGDAAATTANLDSLEFETALGPVRFSQDGANEVSPFGLYRWDGEEFVAEATP